MNTMTWAQIDNDWAEVQKRTMLFERTQEAEAMNRYCVGHSIESVADRIGKPHRWVATRLDYFAAQIATGGVGADTPIIGKHRGALEDVSKIVRDFGPDIKVKVSDDGKGNRKVENVEGNDAEQFEPYLDHYTSQGHEPAAATRLAKAEWATEAAVEAGVIKESVNKRNEKVNQILFPNEAKNTYEMDLQHHMAKVKAAAKFLDTAKVPYLRRKSTCEKVAEANKVWSEQMERIGNFHSTFMETDA